MITLVRNVETHSSSSDQHEEQEGGITGGGGGGEGEGDVEENNTSAETTNASAAVEVEVEEDEEEVKEKFTRQELGGFGGEGFPAIPPSPSPPPPPPLPLPTAVPHIEVLSPPSSATSHYPSRVLPSKPPQLSVVRLTTYSPHEEVTNPGMIETTGGHTATSPTPAEQETFLLPLSSAPIDIITMFTRMASFVGMLLNVLTPKLRQGFQSGRTPPSNGHNEVPSEVAQVREQIAEIQRQTETMRIEFLKKLHKVKHCYNSASLPPPSSSSSSTSSSTSTSTSSFSSFCFNGPCSCFFSLYSLTFSYSPSFPLPPPLLLLVQMMVNVLKLYADNLLCMDLCCWPHGEARDILGEEVREPVSVCLLKRFHLREVCRLTCCLFHTCI